MIGLTQVQQSVLSFADQHHKLNGVMPSYREIADHIGVKSIGRVAKLFDGLEERGAIRRLRGKSRAYEIVSASDRHCVQVPDALWVSLVQYAIAERIDVDLAASQFIRDGLEAA